MDVLLGYGDEVAVLLGYGDEVALILEQGGFGRYSKALCRLENRWKLSLANLLFGPLFVVCEIVFLFFTF